jgi:hypothetical protein
MSKHHMLSTPFHLSFLQNWLTSKQSFSFWICVMLFVVAVVLRSSHITTHLFFGFEQGRDAIQVQDIFQGKDIALVGPKTDIDGIFHGPWYYYFMVLPYVIGKGNPLVAIAFLIAFSSLTPVVTYCTVHEMTKSRWWAALAGLLVASSYLMIQYARWLSNVSPALPLMSMLLWCVWHGASAHGCCVMTAIIGNWARPNIARPARAAPVNGGHGGARDPHQDHQGERQRCRPRSGGASACARTGVQSRRQTCAR